ncbi:SDR family NAD(P)-dependent oxidoreductase [Novosphingobium kaempferiae]|uniref:SDR family NAD(P)-dependent oxidoreductase n=1 Tax=Novosphingobium kaempferiae TaxID=2896849 RepID=UPI001E3B990D|nr:SDR family NAD(P)-dependent oxidoreductase [Novosphingobium kaempferiae]
MDLEDKVVVATAAGNGIGREVMLEFGRRGARLVVSDFDAAAAERVAAELTRAGTQAFAVRCDVTSDSDVNALAEQAFERFGQVDVLMNHAGVPAAGPIHSVPLSDWKWVFDVNVLGIVRALKAFLPAMSKQGSGLIINTASSLGLFPEQPFALPYTTTKAGVIGLTEALALYCRPMGIRAMALVPDITRTSFHTSGRMTALDDDQLKGLLPLDQEQLPTDVCQALFEAIDGNAFIASNVPNWKKLLRDKAEDELMPKFRAYPGVANAVEEFARSA